jgi:hypothetical protein
MARVMPMNHSPAVVTRAPRSISLAIHDNGLLMDYSFTISKFRVDTESRVEVLMLIAANSTFHKVFIARIEQ